jgi:endo-1,4-beta-D-glucanase Y
MFPFPCHVKCNGIKPVADQASLDQSVSVFYQNWKKYIRTLPTSPPQKYVKYNEEKSPDETVSEAHGYGMRISVYMNNKDDFDGLYFYYKRHPSSINPRLMAWKQHMKNGTMVEADGCDSATDGDIDIAYGLLLADAQWGSAGVIKYKSEAIECIKAIFADEVNHESLWNLTVGDWAKSSPRYTRCSDFAIEEMYAFSKVVPEFINVYNATISIVNNHICKTGLLPDFMVAPKNNNTFVPVKGEWLEGPNDGNYYYNSCRTPWRLSMDYIIHGRTTLNEALSRMNNWIKTTTNNKPAAITAGYNITEGTPLTHYSDGCFTFPFAVSAMISPDNQEWLNELWKLIVSSKSENYYNDSIKMFVMLVVSGNCWSPDDHDHDDHGGDSETLYKWYGLKTATSNINMMNTVVPCSLNNGNEGRNRYEAIGFVWPIATNISRVTFTNDELSNNNDGYFTSDLLLQVWKAKGGSKEIQTTRIRTIKMPQEKALHLSGLIRKFTVFA